MSGNSGGPTFINLDYFFGKIYDLFHGVGNFSGGAFLSVLKNILAVLAVFFIFVIIYILVRIYEFRLKERRELMAIIHEAPTPTPKNEKWEQVILHMNSTNQSDWRLAIIEADTMLDEMTKELDLLGENLGERLKAVEPADFTTINAAWEAHKVRNRIAHDGSSFNLTRSDAENTIGLYEEVFKEFKYI